MTMMTITTPEIAFPAWFRRWNGFPNSIGAWEVVKLPAHERSTLLSTQKAFAELMATKPREHPNTEGKRRWIQLRAQYNASKNPALLTELEQIGPRGEILTAQLRTRLHAIRAARRQLTHQRGCRPIYAHVFRLAAAIVCGRLQIEEKNERKACAETGFDFKPSEYLWSLANLAPLRQVPVQQPCSMRNLATESLPCSGHEVTRKGFIARKELREFITQAEERLEFHEELSCRFSILRARLLDYP